MKQMSPQIWKEASPNETLEFYSNLLKLASDFQVWLEALQKNPGSEELAFEYLWIYRSEKETLQVLNHPQFPPEILLRFVYFGFGKKILQEDYISFFSQIPLMFSPDTCLRLLTCKEEIAKDSSLRIHLVASLDPRTWELYFEGLTGENFQIEKVIQIFEDLEEEQIQTILFQNPILSSYLKSLVLLEERNTEQSVSLLEVKIITYLESFEKMQEFYFSLKKQFPLEEEKSKTPKARNPLRLDLIFHRVVQIPMKDRNNFLNFLRASGAIFDTWEEKLLQEAVQNFLKTGKLFFR